VLGIALFGESASPARLGFLALMIVGIVGLKATTPTPAAATSGDAPAPPAERGE
jgi:hypothetical protein